MNSEERFANFMINLVNWSENTGCMPNLGGLLDQSNVFYECRVIVLNEQNSIQHEKEEENKLKSKQKTGTTPPKSRVPRRR